MGLLDSVFDTEGQPEAATGGTGLFGNSGDFLTKERAKISETHTRDYQDRQNPFRMLGGAMKTYNLQNSPEVQQMRDTETIMKQIDVTSPMEVKTGYEALMNIGNTKGAVQLLQQHKLLLGTQAKRDTSVQTIGGVKVLIDNQDGSKIKELGPADDAGQAGPEEKWFDDNNMLIGTKQKDKTGKYAYTRFKQSALVNMGTKEKVKFSLDEFKVANEAATAAESQINNLDYIDQTMAGIETGSLTDWRVAIGRLSSSLNLPVEGDLSSLESSKTAMGNLVMASLNNFPGQISNQERQFLEGIMPSLTQTAKGRAAISGMLRKVANRSLAKRELMQKYVRGTTPDLAPEDGPTFYDEWKQYQVDNPLFDDKTLGTGTFAEDKNGVRYELKLNGDWLDSDGNLYGAEQ